MQPVSFEDIRSRAEKRLKVRTEFYTHLVVYVLINLFFWGLWLLSGGFAWPVIITLGWGIGLVFHAIDMLSKTQLGENRQERALQREIDRELKYRGLTAEELMEKPKRGRDLRLSDDGELVSTDDTENETLPRERRRHRDRNPD